MVRRPGRPISRAGQPRRSRCAAGQPGRYGVVDRDQGADGRGASRAASPNRGRSGPVRRPGAPGAGHRPLPDPRRPSIPGHRAAHLRRGRRRRLLRDARRFGPVGTVGSRRRADLEPDRCAEQGHLGVWRIPGAGAGLLVGDRSAAGGCTPRRPVRPGGRGPVLAGPLRRAGRIDGPPAPGDPGPSTRVHRQPDRPGAGGRRRASGRAQPHHRHVPPTRRDRGRFHRPGVARTVGPPGQHRGRRQRPRFPRPFAAPAHRRHRRTPRPAVGRHQAGHGRPRPARSATSTPAPPSPTRPSTSCSPTSSRVCCRWPGWCRSH